MTVFDIIMIMKVKVNSVVNIHSKLFMMLSNKCLYTAPM